MIKLILSDLDGVLTDGKVWISNEKAVMKSLCFKDIDTRFALQKKGIKFGIITGEKDVFVTMAQERFQPDFLIAGCKQKAAVIQELAKQERIHLQEICYIGDGIYDQESIQIVGIGMCPKDALEEVKEAADCVLETKGGDGCLSELMYLLDHKMELF